MQGTPNQRTKETKAQFSIHLASTDLFRACSSANCEGAWSEFVERFHPRLVSAVRRTLLRFDSLRTSEERVEDLVQEIYCRLLGGGRRRLRRFRGRNEAQLMTYLQRVAASVVVDARRRALAEKRRGGHRVRLEERMLPPSLTGLDADGPEEQLLARERRRAFLVLCRHALGRRASPATVEIARLALLEGWTSREIAAGLRGEMGIAGVDSVIYRLRRNLAGRGITLPRRDPRAAS